MKFGITLTDLSIGSNMIVNPLVIPEGSIVALTPFTIKTFRTIQWKGHSFTMSENWPLFIKELSDEKEKYLASLLWG